MQHDFLKKGWVPAPPERRAPAPRWFRALVLAVLLLLVAVLGGAALWCLFR